MTKILCALTASTLALGMPKAFPISLDIGTFAIDDYLGNGGGTTNLNYMIASGQNFWWGANVNVNGYSAPSAGPVSNPPTIALDVRNKDVTWSAITNPSQASGNREYCDFVYYGGHGFDGSPYLGAGGNYGQVFPTNLGFGVGYNRWFIGNSCSLFHGGNPATVWQPAFKGLKAMLGFESFVYDNSQSWDLYNRFWYNWTRGEQSLLNAFFNAESDYGYKQLYPTRGLKPGCLSAEVPASRGLDYCREAFKYVDHNYNRAIANTGYYYFKVLGSPQY